MATEKNINSRVQQKHDIEINWNKATNFIPKDGEIIIYDKDDNYNYARIKIGDGVTNVINLPFIDETKADKTDLETYEFISIADIDAICASAAIGSLDSTDVDELTSLLEGGNVNE